MKTVLSIFVFFLFLSANAQQPETKFLEKKPVRWAAYASGNFHFDEPNLSLVLRKLFVAQKLRAATVSQTDHRYTNVPLTLSEAAKPFLPAEVIVYDDENNPGSSKTISAPTQKINQLFFEPAFFDSATNNLVNVEQFFYVEKGKLFSHVSWVSPAYKVITPGGVYLGDALLFNCFYNKEKNVPRSAKRNAVKLATTKVFMTDSAAAKNMIKQWYGETLVKAIWPGLSNKSVEIYRLDSSKKISVNELNENIWNKSRLPVPVYDSLGNISGSRADNWPLDVSVFDKVEIEQEWFYNPSKQLVWNNITSLILYAPRFVNGEFEKNSTPLLKIIYK